jgi:NCAIR mutase (PurE)-related protein
MKEKGTFTTSEGTGGYNNKPLNQFKITIQTPVEWLQEQYNQCPKYEERIYEQDWEQAKEMEKEQIMRTARQCYFEGVRKRAKTTEELIEYAEQYYNETFKQEQ